MKNSGTHSRTSRYEAMRIIAAGSTVELLRLSGNPLASAEASELS